jgi:hypothetical protein
MLGAIRFSDFVLAAEWVDRMDRPFSCQSLSPASVDKSVYKVDLLTKIARISLPPIRLCLEFRHWLTPANTTIYWGVKGLTQKNTKY